LNKSEYKNRSNYENKNIISNEFVLIISSNYFAQSISFGPQLGFAKSTDADQTSLCPELQHDLVLWHWY